MPRHLPFRFNPTIERRHQRLRRLTRKRIITTLSKAEARALCQAAAASPADAQRLAADIKQQHEQQRAQMISSSRHMR